MNRPILRASASYHTTKIAARVSDATLVSAQGFATGGCESGELVGDGDTPACSAFEAVPGNLAVLRVVARLPGASLPHGTTLHPDAGSVQIVTPRDYAPVSDGSCYGHCH